IPAEVLFRDKDCSAPGLVRTYGILPEDRDPVAAEGGPGGGGAAFRGIEDYDEDGVLIETGMSSYNAKEERLPEDFPLGQTAAVDAQINFTCGTDENGEVVKTWKNGPDGTAFTDTESYTWKGYLKAPETGDYSLMLQCVGGMAGFFIKMEDGWAEAGRSAMREWAQWPWESLICTREGMGITGKMFRLEEGRCYEILVNARQCVKNKDLQIRIAWQKPSFRKENYEAALSAAKEADTIIYYACEHVMRDIKAIFGKIAEEQPLELTGDQMQLLNDVIAAKKPGAKLIVNVQTSNARALGEWEAYADAILTAYHPGQEGARVIAKILAGRINPSGKLSQTWPAKTADTPLTDSREHLEERGRGTGPDRDVRIRMTEGIFSGYRYYDKEGVKPLYPFGHGLSYTEYAYDGLKIEQIGDIPDFGSTIRVSFRVKNTGTRTGDEIAQIYIGKGEVPGYMQIAEKQLIGYIRVKGLAPGEEREVSVTIDPRMLRCWDPAMTLQKRSDGTLDKWVLPSGEREVLVGASSADIRLRGTAVLS
ncbi:MAG: glycoside hydrolase family 3 C-terminal domain-containing protein, partial [Parasporobacterium sp.]|nr:glycoside hydrolase family 3 C-terminal domain-containing protein [Parasporobacterium sp.]